MSTNNPTDPVTPAPSGEFSFWSRRQALILLRNEKHKEEKEEGRKGQGQGQWRNRPRQGCIWNV
jgi:hypothetical protein